MTGWGDDLELRVQAVRLKTRLAAARRLALALRDEKSDHPWSNMECDLLVRLIKVLCAKDFG